MYGQSKLSQPSPQCAKWSGSRAAACYDGGMTKLLDQAIAKVRELPAEDQETLAVVLLSMAAGGSAIPPLDEETRAAIREGLDQARQGQFAADEEIAELWSRHGL